MAQSRRGVARPTRPTDPLAALSDSRSSESPNRVARSDSTFYSILGTGQLAAFALRNSASGYRLATFLGVLGAIAWVVLLIYVGRRLVD